MATTSPLRQRMIEDMMIRNLSRATQQSYIYAVARFSRHFNSSPDRLGMEEVRAYQLHLVAKNHSWSGPRPWLHRLRSGSLRLVRQLRGYYDGVRLLGFVHRRL